MIRYCLDVRTVHPHFPGIARYTSNLARALGTEIGADEELVLLGGEGATGLEPATGAHCHRLAIDVSAFSIAQHWRIPLLLRRSRVDVYHCPYVIMPARPGVPSVVTMHDLIPLHFPHYFGTGSARLFRIAARTAARAANLIITVSKATAIDLQKFLGIEPGRIRVILSGPDPRLRPPSEREIAAGRARLHLPQRYALYIGSNRPHKNLVRLVEAWSQLGAERVPLLIAGPWDPRFPEAQTRIRQLGLGDSVRLLGRVEDADLNVLYGAALLFVFPSEHEGFGLPVIEAMACGTPVACADAGGLPEVAGGAAQMLPPDDVDGMAAIVRELLADDERRAQLRERGLRRAAELSWTDAARRTLAVYREVAVMPR
jgi:glycosyltransferase involved in cell wall biosynthesis